MNPRKPSVTAGDVARRAGVSRAVVSRALSNNGSISPDARARVLRAAEELGYQVNFLARGLNRQRSHLIGVIVSRISDPFAVPRLMRCLTRSSAVAFRRW